MEELFCGFPKAYCLNAFQTTIFAVVQGWTRYPAFFDIQYYERILNSVFARSSSGNLRQDNRYPDGYLAGIRYLYRYFAIYPDFYSARYPVSGQLFRDISWLFRQDIHYLDRFSPIYLVSWLVFSRISCIRTDFLRYIHCNGAATIFWRLQKSSVKKR